MFDSIRTRLTLWYVGILAVFIVAVSLIIYSVLMSTLDRDLDLRLKEIAGSVKTAVASEERELREEEDGEERMIEAVKEASDEMRLKDFPFIVYGPGGEVIANTADFDVAFEDGGVNETFFDIPVSGNKLRAYRTDLGPGGQHFALKVFHSLTEKQTLQRQLGMIFLFLIPLTLFLAGFVGSFLAKKSLKPVGEMRRQAQMITANNLDERLLVRNEHDELGQLTIVMNELLERLAASFEQQKRFMADASHELRTPIAIVRGESEVALSKPDRATEEYRDALRVISDESQRLSKIVEDLFILARADAGQFNTHFEPIYLDEVVADSVRSISVLARAKNVRISISANGEMPMNADELLLRRLFVNLLDNAVKYNRDGGSILVEHEISNDSYKIQISDTGKGISVHESQLVFERFYRSDKSRNRDLETETSGAGLGLAIAQWVAAIHNGKVELTSSSAAGSTFSVILPR
jgi:heavy metal sensor kinase